VALGGREGVLLCKAGIVREQNKHLDVWLVILKGMMYPSFLITAVDMSCCLDQKRGQNIVMILMAITIS